MFFKDMVFDIDVFGLKAIEFTWVVENDSLLTFLKMSLMSDFREAEVLPKSYDVDLFVWSSMNRSSDC